MKTVQKNMVVKKPSEDTITVFTTDKKGGIRVVNVAGTGLSQKEANKIFGGKLI